MWGERGGGEEGGGKITPCLKLIRNLKFGIHKIILLVSRYLMFSFSDVSFFCEKSAFFDKISAFTQSNIIRAVLKIF